MGLPPTSLHPYRVKGLRSPRFRKRRGGHRERETATAPLSKWSVINARGSPFGPHAASGTDCYPGSSFAPVSLPSASATARRSLSRASDSRTDRFLTLPQSLNLLQIGPEQAVDLSAVAYQPRRHRG